MAAIVKTFPGVYGGVSSQTDSLRKDNQVEEMINCTPSLVLGTVRRPNVVEDSEITIASDTSFIYDYTRDDTETNIFTVNPSGTLVAQRLGVGDVAITVPAAVSTYLTATDSDSLNGITIGDTTFITNNEQVVTTALEPVSGMTSLDAIYTTDSGDVERYASTTAYYWLSRSSNDADHPYNYVIELDGVSYEALIDKSEDAARILANKIKFNSQFCNITVVHTPSNAYFTVQVKTGSVVGSGTPIDIDGFLWDSIGGGAITYTRASPGYYTVTVHTVNEINPIAYVMNIGEQEFVVATEVTIEAVVNSFEAQLQGFVGTLVTPTRNANGFNSEAKGSVVKIWKDTFADFTFNYWDSWGSLASYGWKYDVSKLQDLPSSFPFEGAVVAMRSSDSDISSTYYVKYWKGTWREYTNKVEYVEGVKSLPVLKNMPIVITRQVDGTFAASVLTEADQLKPALVGNDDNNKNPAFVGKTIKQLFYINGRMCIVSGATLTFSETDVLWNFYATTIVNVLDGDTLEVPVTSEKVIKILRVAIFQSGLLIMTSEGQYIFNTESGISPSNVIINKLSNYAYNDKGGTVYDGDSIVFSGYTGNSARLYRYRVARLTSENKAIDLTIQIPTYIQGQVTKIVTFIEDGLLGVLPENSKKIYMYREIISGDQMVQSSWYTWDFSNILTSDILDITVVGPNMYLLTVDGVYHIPLGVVSFNANYVHLDLGTTPYESRVVLTKWRPKKTAALVQTPRGRLQLRTISVSLDGIATLEIFKEDRNYYQNKDVLHNKGINILSNSDTTVLSLINKGTSPFAISGIALSGTHREKGKETT